MCELEKKIIIYKNDNIVQSLLFQTGNVLTSRDCFTGIEKQERERDQTMLVLITPSFNNKSHVQYT